MLSCSFWPQNLSTYIHTHTRRKVNPKTDCDICAAMHETYICSTGKISTCIQPVLSFRELHSLNRMWHIFLVGWLHLLCTISPSTSIVLFCYFFPSLSSFFSTRRTICCHNFWTLRICVPVCAVFGLIAQVFHVFFVRSCRMRDMKLYIFNESYALSLSPSLSSPVSCRNMISTGSTFTFRFCRLQSTWVSCWNDITIVRLRVQSAFISAN